MISGLRCFTVKSVLSRFTRFFVNCSQKFAMWRKNDKYDVCMSINVAESIKLVCNACPCFKLTHLANYSDVWHRCKTEKLHSSPCLRRCFYLPISSPAYSSSSYYQNIMIYLLLWSPVWTLNDVMSKDTNEYLHPKVFKNVWSIKLTLFLLKISCLLSNLVISYVLPEEVLDYECFCWTLNSTK